MIDINKEVLAAEKRIRPYIRKTPLDYSFYLSKTADSQIFLKFENLQHTGSFKVRGAVNKMLCLTSSEKIAGVTAASTGNHGLAVAYAASKLGIKACIYLPETASAQKVQILKNYDVEINYYGNDCGETESHARAEAQRYNRTYISPYNDEKVIGGQGTIGVEILAQMKSVDTVMVSVGGGGLISGIAGYLKNTKPSVKMLACQPQNSAVMYESLKAGHIVDLHSDTTLSDGTAGGVDKETITFEPCRRYIDDWVLVDENEIRRAIRLIFEHHRQVIEGAAAVAVASFIKIRNRLKGKNVALVICGGNIDLSIFKEIAL
jgi:threonine dehydratase